MQIYKTVDVFKDIPENLIGKLIKSTHNGNYSFMFCQIGLDRDFYGDELSNWFIANFSMDEVIILLFYW